MTHQRLLVVLGSAVSFDLTVAAGTVAVLTVIDGGCAGDVFGVTVNRQALPNTSTGTHSFPNAVGALLLEVSAVPELSTVSSLRAGLGLRAVTSRRRAAPFFQERTSTP